MRDGYNGWANRETWQVNLEMFDGFDPSDVWDTNAADREELTDSLAEYLEETTAEAVGIPESSHFAWGVMHEFLRRVDWQEIAAHMVEDYADQLPAHLRADSEAAAAAAGDADTLAGAIVAALTEPETRERAGAAARAAVASKLGAANRPTAD